MSPTARSLAYLRKAGFVAEVVEKWIPGANIRRDFLGIIDILAFRPGSPVMVGVQATSRSNMGARQRKAMESTTLIPWVSSGHMFLVWGWDKKGTRWRGTVTRWEMVGGWGADWSTGGETDELREALERCTSLRPGHRV